MKVRLKNMFLCFVVAALTTWPCIAPAENTYVGTAECKNCHEKQYENFTKFAKKAHSAKSVKIMASDLTEAELAGCYGCHTTGYGKPGGFVSYEKTLIWLTLGAKSATAQVQNMLKVAVIRRSSRGR